MIMTLIGEQYIVARCDILVVTVVRLARVRVVCGSKQWLARLEARLGSSIIGI